MLEAIDLAAQRGSTRLFAGLGFSVTPGCALLVTGANGTGKTTLLRILAGLCTPVAGRVRWRGEDVVPFAQHMRQDAVFCGHLPAVKDELSAEENLSALAALAGEKTEPSDVRDALATVALDRQRSLPAKALSQGQRRRLGLARLSVVRRPLWLLDEPASALDTEGIALLTRLLAAHLERGGFAVAATHHAFDLPEARVRRLALS